MSNRKRNPNLHSQDYYQEIINLRKDDNRLVIQLLLEVALVIEKSSDEKIKASIANLIDKIEPREKRLVINDPHINKVSDAFFYIIMSRLVFKNLLDSFSSLANWWALQKNDRLSKWDYRADIWEKIVEIRLYDFHHRKANSLSKQLVIFDYTLRGLLLDISKSKNLNSTELRKLPDNSFGLIRSLKSRQKALTIKFIDIVKDLLIGMQAIIQILLDDAITEIIKGNKPKKLDELNELNYHLYLLLKKDDLGILNAFIDTTVFENKLHSGIYLDALLYNNSTKSKDLELKYSHYNSEGELDASGRQTQIIFTIRQRTAQISFIKYLFGLSSKHRTFHGGIELSNSELSNCMRKIGNNYSIHDNDTWVKIVIILFQMYEKKALKLKYYANKASDIALIASIQHFTYYLDTFTEHSKFNIRDKGKNYFDTFFPRTITGRSLHDCGVYALRIAYVIKQLSQKIKRIKKSSTSLLSNMYFINLPFHVGMMIELGSGSAIVTHNKSLEFFEKTEIEYYKEKWKNTDISGDDISNTPSAFNKMSFIAELSAPIYIQGIDHPVLIVPIGLDAKTNKLEKRRLWFAFLRMVIPNIKFALFSFRITKKTDPVYQFPMRYIELTEMRRDWYNKYIVKQFWNSTAFNAWKNYKELLERHFNNYKEKVKKSNTNTKIEEERQNLKPNMVSTDGQIKGIEHKKQKNVKQEKLNSGLDPVKKAYNDFISHRESYLSVLENGIDEVEKSMYEIAEKQAKLNSDLVTYPYVLNKKAIRTYHKRLTLGNINMSKVENHIDKMKLDPSLLSKLPIPPFATEEDWLEPIPE